MRCLMASTMIGACCRWSSASMVSMSIMGLLFWSKSARLDMYSSRIALLDAIMTEVDVVGGWLTEICFQTSVSANSRTHTCTNTTTLRLQNLLQLAITFYNSIISPLNFTAVDLCQLLATISWKKVEREGFRNCVTSKQKLGWKTEERENQRR